MKLKRFIIISVIIAFIIKLDGGANYYGSLLLGVVAGAVIEFIWSVIERPKPEIVVEAEEEEYKYPPMPTIHQNTGTTHGTANWEDPADIRFLYTTTTKEGWLDGSYYIGCGYYIQPLVHGVTIAGSGQGKGVCLIVPSLLSVPRCSYFLLDPKGEIAIITARYQQSRGQKVVILDPWNEQKRLGATHGIEPMGFNPLEFIKGNPDEMPESCGVIAEMLIPDNTRSSDSYWESRARSLVKTYLLHLITARPEQEQHLGTLYRWLRLPISLRKDLWLEMYNNLECDELVRSGIGEFLGLSEESGPLPSIISTAQDNTTFLESVPLRASLERNDFDPYELTNGMTTVYLCLPERFLNSHARWLRIVVGVCLKACNYRPDRRVNFMLDEFAILGKMNEVQRAYAFSRGQNISMWIFVQSLTQLVEIYGEHGANSFLANARLRQFFGIYDLHTQKYLSEYLGDTTVNSITRSQSHSSGGSSGSSSGWSTTGSSSGSSSGSSWSSSTTSNEQPMGRRLLTAEEVGKTSSIITLIDGHKYQIPRAPFWDDIHEAYLEGRTLYYPVSEMDWHKFIDEVEGRSPKRKELGVVFVPRAEGKKIDLGGDKPKLIG